MLTLSYGYKKPQSGDKGGVFFPALEDNIQRLNDHTHDGADSSKLTTQSVLPVSATILVGAWALTANNTYRVAKSMPTGMDFDDYIPSFRLDDGSADDGAILALSVRKLTATSYEVFTNTPVQMKVVYR